jgi:predicted RNA-binding Zn-ribbon protein involved in translation (DUF1610 family)
MAKEKGKSLYDIMEELGIKICPICGNEYTGYPAISRKDNETEICPSCGHKEAIQAFKDNMTPEERERHNKLLDDLQGYINEHLENKEDDELYCIFEKRICRFARKKGNSFNCIAKSDNEMTCKKHK